MQNSNAYNFSIFQDTIPKEPKIFQIPSRKINTKIKRNKKVKFYFKCLSTVLCLGTIFSAFLFGQAKLVECENKISNSSNNLEELKNTNEQLEIKLNSKKYSNNLHNNPKSSYVESIVISSEDKVKIN